jgi:hypothetical protein
MVGSSSKEEIKQKRERRSKALKRKLKGKCGRNKIQDRL